jgi:hypothetical protein
VGWLTFAIRVTLSGLVNFPYQEQVSHWAHRHCCIKELPVLELFNECIIKKGFHNFFITVEPKVIFFSLRKFIVRAKIFAKYIV